MKRHILFYLLIISHTTFLYAVDDTFDTTFNSALEGAAPLQAGVRIDQIHPNSSTSSGDKGVVLQSDDKIVVGGRANFGGTNRLAVARFETNGARDASFGANGVTTTFFGSGTNIFGEHIAIQSDDKIVLTGRISPDVPGAIAVARYKANGALDASFNPNGTLPGTKVGIFGAATNSILAVDIDSDGKILVSGRAELGPSELLVARFNSDGSIDTSFGSSGFITFNQVDPTKDHDGFGITALSDGKILVGGYALIGGLTLGLLVRLTNTGALDTTFGGGDGWITEDFGFPANHSSIVKILPQGDGSIIILGQGDLKASIAKLTSTGDPYPGFTKGVVAGTSVFRDGAVQSDGKIFAVGRSSGPSESLIARYNADGTPDSTFGTAGVLIMNLDGVGGGEDIRSMVLQSNGNLVFLGDTDGGEFVMARLLVSSISGAISSVAQILGGKFRRSLG